MRVPGGTPIVVVALALAALPGAAGSFVVVPEESDLVVVTHKDGFAAKLAHDHTIAASAYDARLEFDPGNPSASRFELTVPVHELTVDDPVVQARISPRLEQLAVRVGPFPEVTEKDRAAIRAAMLGPRQLDAERHATITATADVSRRRAAVSGEADRFPYLVDLRVEILGRVVERQATARYEYRAGRLEVEAYASFEFTDFGIKPYSAFLGAVRNRNEFHVYVSLTAVAKDRS